MSEAPSPGEPRPIGPRLVVIVALHLAVLFSATAVAVMAGGSGNALLSRRAASLALGSLESALTLVAVGFAFGGSASWGLLVTAASVVGVFLAPFSPHLACIILPLFVFGPFVPTTLLGEFAGRFGWQWVNEREAPSEPVRFSLLDLLLSVLVCTGFLALVRATTQSPQLLFERRDEFRQGLGFGGLSIVVELLLIVAPRVAVVVAAAGSSVRLPVVVLVLSVAYLVGLAAWFRQEDYSYSLWPSTWEASVWATAQMLAAAFAIASLLAIRAGGWRIDRLAKKAVVPTTSESTAGASSLEGADSESETSPT